LAVALAVVWTPALAAQSVTYSALRGRVVDAAGQPVAEVEVRVRDRASGSERAVLTARDGAFSFTTLMPASYDVTAEALGFRPTVHTGVALLAGGSVRVTIRLARATPPVHTVDTVVAHSATSPAMSWLSERGYADLVGGRRVLSDVAGLSPLADRDGIEGLPWRLAEVTVDGARTSGVGQPRAVGFETAALAAPLRAMATIGTGSVGYDVEAGGTGTGLRATSARAGGNELRATLEGGSANLGGALVSGTVLQRDTAYALLGLDYQRSEVALPPWFGLGDAAGAQLADVARTTHATDLSAFLAETPQVEERWSAWGRFDWQQGDRVAITLRAAASRLKLGDPPLLGGTRAGLGSLQETTTGQLALTLLARLTRRVSLEVRVSGDVGESSARTPSFPSTSFASRGLTLGGSSDEPFEDSRTTPRVSTAVHAELGAHRLKAGLALATHSFDHRVAPVALGAFRFGDATDFTALSGAWYGLEDLPGAARFRASERALFVQDAWRVTDGLDLTFGFRSDALSLPVDDLAPDAGWAAVSGVSVNDRESSRSRFAPRLGFRWQMGEQRQWVLEGGAGAYHALPDRRDLAEAVAFDAGASARYAVGALGSWPTAPVTATAAGRTLSLLGPDYEGPRTRRASIGVQRRGGPWTVYANGTYRHTDFLTRRRDLNLPVGPVGTDQYGRPLYGELTQVGTLIAATPLSNRRFAGYDAVYALEATGYSDFWALGAGIDRVVERGLSLSLNYTHARTEDNGLGNTGSDLSPFRDGFGGRDWQVARADADAPHRVIAAAEWRTGIDGALRIGGVYRLRSGDRFTAGFRDGVDVNGDGDGGNDPAFIDPAAPGMDALLADWECLAEDGGSFARRNGCRTDWAHRLDVRLAFRLAQLRMGRFDIVIDAIDILGLEQGPIDRALYLVDRSGTLSRDALTGVTTLPLIVNPAFGTRLADRSPGVLWRVGLRIGQ